jgi:hypothetical protein
MPRPADMPGKTTRQRCVSSSTNHGGTFIVHEAFTAADMLEERASITAKITGSVRLLLVPPETIGLPSSGLTRASSSSGIFTVLYSTFSSCFLTFQVVLCSGRMCPER